MIKYVLDASAILALIFFENGWQKVDKILYDSAISTVNAAEVLTKLIQDNISLEKASKEIFNLNVPVIGYTWEQALKSAELRPVTKHLGLSLGDRACLALAIQERATAVTAERIWASLDVCKIEIIR